MNFDGVYPKNTPVRLRTSQPYKDIERFVADDKERLKATALTELGERQISAIARNYYISAAQYLLRELPARRWAPLHAM